MSLNVAMNVAVSGLLANQKAIAATSENVANVNTADFARRETTFVADAIPNQFAGVNAETARAAVDRFLQGAFYRGAGDAAGSRLVADSLAAVEASLGAPGENISFANRLDEAFAALATLAANPSSTAAKADALARLDEAFSSFARSLDAVDAESAGALSRLEAATVEANARLSEIYRLNQVVADSGGAADRIDAAIAGLARLVPVEVARDADGRVTVVSGGRTLVDAAGFSALGVSAGPPTAVTLAAIDPQTGASFGVSSDISGELARGEVAALVGLRNTELPRLAGLVDSAQDAIAAELNAAYAPNVAAGASAPLGRALIGDVGGRLGVDPALLGDPASFAIARPSSGPGGLNDGSGAAALAGVSGSVAARLPAEAVAHIDAASGAAQRAAAGDSAIADEISVRLASAAGVNLDEELSNLIVYQRAYGANARVIAAVDELWQSLLSII